MPSEVTPAPDATPPAAPRLRVLLYNVWGLPPCLTDGQTRARAAKIAPHLAAGDYDVIVFNEAFTNKTLLTSALAESHPHRARLGRQWYTPMDSGLLVASRHPIVRTAGEHYARRAGVDRWAAKGVVYACLRTPAGLVDLYATHMQAGAAPAHQAARLSQSAQLANFILRLSGDGERPIVACGDLNMGPTLDPTFARHSAHYVSPEDAKARHFAYMLLRVRARLNEVIADERRNREDILRFLVRDAPGAARAPARLSYEPWATRDLSDTPALLCELALPPAPAPR